MSLWVNISGTWHKGVLWQNVAGTWKKVNLYANVGGVWKKTLSDVSNTALNATAGSNYVFGSVSRQTAVRVFTNAASISANGGIGSYSYSWGIQAGWTIESPNSNTTRFSAIVSASDDKTADFLCTVTDSAGSTANVTVTAEVANYYSGGRGDAQIQ